VAPASRLTPLQQRLLELLAPVRPRWTLTRGGALAGIHLQHRTTRDLDLFWHGQDKLEREADDAIARIEEDGLTAETVQRHKGFVRLQVRDDRESTIVDLVAEPVPFAEAPVERPIGRQSIQVDSQHEILVNKLGALLHRAEIRDLVDLRGLLAGGGSLERARRDANAKDRGFSPLTLGWMLQSFPVRKLAQVAGHDPADAADLERFRGELAQRVAYFAQP
jgi:hypothetical protein